MIMLLGGAICLLGATAALAEMAKQYELKEYEELVGKKLEFHESPMFRIRVAAGELPPVEERLPEEPLVIKPAEEIGQYGGTIRVVAMDIEHNGSRPVVLIMAKETMLRLDPLGETILPNIAKDWKLSKDAKTLTLYLRKGMKWSDGVPFTADDVMFWYEDIKLNDELTPVKLEVWSPGGEFMKMEKIDDYTVRIHFAKPHPLAARLIAYGDADSFYACKHYLKQFHPRYVPIEKLKKMAKEEGVDFWYQLFLSKYIYPLTHDVYRPARYPTLAAYVSVEKKLDHGLGERNPYYWKVDTEGNQLPYCDKHLVVAVMDPEARTGKIMSGEIDFDGVNTRPSDLPLYQANAEKGDYRILMYKSGFASEAYFMPNQTCRDPVLRKIFRDIRFRQALSVAINRQEINQSIFFGLGIPGQLTISPFATKWYKEEFGRAYAQYDPREANRLLDEMGLKWDKDDRWRLRSDGNKLTIVCHFTEVEAPTGGVCELVRE